MILVTRLNDSPYYLNPFLIETVEATPDTVITTITGKKLMVKEEVTEIIARMNAFYKSIHPESLPARILYETKRKKEGDEP